MGCPARFCPRFLLFSIYVNLLGETVNNHNMKMHGYADDTDDKQWCLAFKADLSGEPAILDRRRDCISEIRSWITCNIKPKLNVDRKTKFTLFGTANDSRK